QEGRGIGLHNKLRAYELQDQGMDTVDANLALGFPADRRDYGIGMQILFYGTPIVYQLTDVPEKIGGIPVRAIVELSPLTQYTIQSRQVTYLLEFPTLRQVGYTFVVSLITLVFGWWVFSRRAADVIEEI
ncbi:MAG TPA: hypothetical protein PLY51_14185, partial [Microthrixaceae bacterium]|nr:hypothetical protein [Microthrixaceae bacterium]